MVGSSTKPTQNVFLPSGKLVLIITVISCPVEIEYIRKIAPFKIPFGKLKIIMIKNNEILFKEFYYEVASLWRCQLLKVSILFRTILQQLGSMRLLITMPLVKRRRTLNDAFNF